MGCLILSKFNGKVTMLGEVTLNGQQILLKEAQEDIRKLEEEIRGNNYETI